MRKASIFVGATLTAASLALAAPAMASPAPTVGLSDAISTAAGTPGALAISAPKSAISVQEAGKDGARVGGTTADGAYSQMATDGTVTASALYRPTV
jgi:hypothetical protein